MVYGYPKLGRQSRDFESHPEEYEKGENDNERHERSISKLYNHAQHIDHGVDGYKPNENYNIDCDDNDNLPTRRMYDAINKHYRRHPEEMKKDAKRIEKEAKERERKRKEEERKEENLIRRYSKYYENCGIFESVELI